MLNVCRKSHAWDATNPYITLLSDVYNYTIAKLMVASQTMSCDLPHIQRRTLAHLILSSLYCALCVVDVNELSAAGRVAQPSAVDAYTYVVNDPSPQM